VLALENNCKFFNNSFFYKRFNYTSTLYIKKKNWCLKLHVPFQLLRARTPRMFRKDCHYIARPLWTSDSVCLSPFVPSTPRSDNLVRPLRTPFYSLSCLLTRKRSVYNPSSQLPLIIEECRVTYAERSCRIYQGTRKWDRRWCDLWAVRERSRDAYTVSSVAARPRTRGRSLRCLQSFNSMLDARLRDAPSLFRRGTASRRVIVSNLAFSQIFDGTHKFTHSTTERSNTRHPQRRIQ